MDYPPESFDMIMAHSVIHLIKDRKSVIDKLRHLLKKDGYLILNTPCIEDSFKFFKYIWKPFYLLGVFPYVETFSKSEMISLIDPQYFEVVEEWTPDKGNFFQVIRKNNGN